METAALIAALLALGGAVAAVSLRNLIHCALCLVVTFFSVAVLYLLLGAEFVSFAQVMVYVGAIAILIVFATLLTRSAGMPHVALAWVPSYCWFAVKLFGCIAVFIWLRGTMPRLRADQLMSFAWKFMLPLSLVTLVAAGLWHATSGWQFVGAGLARWALGGAAILLPYQWLSRGLMGARQWRPREYRFAD